MSGVRDAGGVFREIKGIGARNAANVLKTASTALVRDAGNVLRQFFSALSAVVSPENVAGIVSRTGSSPVTTESSTASPQGGVAPFTYLWAAVAAPGWSIATPTAPTTRFTSPSLAASQTATGFFSCTITDATGAVAVSGRVKASATNIGSEFSGGFVP